MAEIDPAGVAAIQSSQVDFKHPDYVCHIDEWQRCRDCVEGELAVKRQGTRYLPQLSGTDDSEYAAYKNRAEFFAAANKVVMGLSGAVMRKPPAIEDGGIGELLDHLGTRGEPLQLLAKQTLEETLTTGRTLLYVDAPADAGEPADPFVAIYSAENVINWREARGPDGRMSAVLIVLQEQIEVPVPGDDFATKPTEQFRVLSLEGYDTDGDGDDDGAGTYTVRVYHRVEWEDGRGQKQKGFEQIGDDIVPTSRGGKAFNFIPAVFVAPNGIGGDVEKSPISDLVAVNLSHYRTSADLEHGRHLAALPTLCVAGFDVKGNKIRVGPGECLATTDTGSKAWYVEFSGAGLQSLERALTEKEMRMAVLGARLLEGQKAGVEAAEAIRLRTSGEHSVLSNVAASVSAGLTKVLGWVRDWVGGSGEISIKLSNDFNATSLDAPMMTALLNMLLAGKISWETYIFNLARGEILPDGVDAEQERQRILEGSPMQPPPPRGSNGNGAAPAGGGAAPPRAALGMKTGENAADVAS